MLFSNIDSFTSHDFDVIISDNNCDSDCSYFLQRGLTIIIEELNSSMIIVKPQKFGGIDPMRMASPVTDRHTCPLDPKLEVQ